MGSAIDRFLERTGGTPEPAETPAPASSPSSGLDQWLARGTQAGTERLRTSAGLGAETPPELAARVLRLQRQSGLSADVVAADVDGLEAQAKRASFDPDTFRRAAPRTADWIAEHPNHFALAQDDLPRLAALEDAVKGAGWWRNLGKGLGGGLIQAETGVGHALEAVGETAAADPLIPISPQGMVLRGLSPLLRKVGGLVKRDAATSAEFYTPHVGSYREVHGLADLRDYLGFQLGQGVGSMASIVAGALAGGVPAAAAAGGTLAFGDVRQELESLGVEAGGAKNAIALGLAIPIAALDQITPGQIAGKLAARGVGRAIVREAAQHGLTRTVAAAAIRSAAEEGGTEVAQEIIQYLGTRAATGQPIEGGELATRATDALIGGALGGGVFGGAGGMAEAPAVRQAERNRRFFQALSETATESKFAERLPEAMQTVVERMTQDGPVATVYAPVEAWITYFQGAGLDPAQVAEDVIGPEGRERYAEAVATGGDLPIPTARYARMLAATEHHDALADELRLSPLEMNAREAKEATEAAATAQVEESQAAAPSVESAQRVAAVVTEQLTAAGFDEGVATAYASLYESAFRTLGERAGQDPLALFNQFGLTVQRTEAPADVPGAPTLSQGETAEEREASDRRILAKQVPLGAPGISVEPAAGIVRVAARDAQGAPIGLLSLVPSDEGSADVLGVYVVPEQRRRGIATQLYDAAAQAGYQVRSGRSGFSAEGEQFVRARSERRGEAMPAVLFQSRANQGPRAQIRIGEQSIQIDLFQNADLSSFLHESGHFYLEVLRQMGEAPEAASAIREDYDAIRGWLGIESGAAITREQHEQFARGFEAYLMDGKAPTSELRRAFAKFRAWLVGIYRQMTSLDVTLTPEVRRVFDRLLATEDEIRAAEAEQAQVPLFADPEMVGMSAAQATRYRTAVERAHQGAEEELAARLLADLTREQKAWWRQERETMREAVVEDVRQEPAQIARSVLQRGTLPDGAPMPEGMQAVKLDSAVLREMAGPERFRRLTFLSARVNGVHPDLAATMFGFGSGQELVDALSAAEPFKVRVERVTDARMKEEHGDLLTDGRLPEAAMQAVHTDHRARLLREELLILATEQTGAFKDLTRRIVRRVPPIEAVRAAAEATIRAKTVRTIRPIEYQRAEARAAKQALESFLKGDFAAAFDWKQKELLNHELYRAATTARETVESIVDYLRGFDRTSTRQRIGKAGGDYLDQIDALRERYSFTRRSLVRTDRLKTLAQWAAEQEQAGRTVDVPEALLDEARRQSYVDTPLEELEGVRDTVRQIAHLATTKNTLLASKRARELDEAADLATGSIVAHAKRVRPKEIETRLPGTQIGRGVESWFAGHRKYASLLREMDGFEDGGPLWDLLVRPVNEAATAEASMNEAATVALQGLVTASYTPAEIARFYRKALVPGTNLRLSMMGRLMVALNWGNAVNRERVLEGYGWTETTAQAILDTLEAKDWTFVQGVWDHLDSYRAALFRLGKDLTGLEPKAVEALPFRALKGGNMRGGYFPIVYDDRQSQMAHRHSAERMAERITRGAAVRATTEKGMLEARVEGPVRAAIRLDFGVIFEHVGEVIHTVTHTRVLTDVSRILEHERVRGAIVDHYGDVVYRQLTGTLQDIAAGDLPAQNAFEQAVGWARQGATIAGLGWNLMTSFLQPLGLANSIVRIGPKWVGRGIARWIGDATRLENSVGWVHARSDFMRLRHKTMQREINEIRNTIGLNTGKVTGWIDEALSMVTNDTVSRVGIADSYFWLIGRAQMLADMPTWLGAYEQAMADGATDEATAIARADQAVLDSQGGGQVKDLASIQRGGPLLKLWTNFYSYFNVVYNQLAESVGRTNVRHPAEVGRLAVDVLLLVTVPAVLGTLLRNAVKGDDDEDLGTLLVQQQLSYLAGMMLFTRELSGAIQGYHGYEGPAGARFFAALGNLVKQTTQGEADAAFWKALNQASGILFHYPAGQVERTVRGIAAVQEGRTSNPLAVLFGPPKQ